MTTWSLDLDKTAARRVWNKEQTALTRWDKDNDFQKGDRVTFEGEAQWLGSGWEITHVIKNQNGIDDGYAVLCLKPPDADYYEKRAKELTNANEKLARSNAALRGQITKLRSRLGVK